MKSLQLLILLLSVNFQALAQIDCNDLLSFLGKRDIFEPMTGFERNCGPFTEQIAEDGMSKTWRNEEKGIEITFVNRAKNQFSLPKFEVLMIELTAFTDKGGFDGIWPFGFKLGMDHKMVKSHISDLESVAFEKKDLSKTSSSFTYMGTKSEKSDNRAVKVSIVQFDGKTISSMRMRLK